MEEDKYIDFKTEIMGLISSSEEERLSFLQDGWQVAFERAHLTFRHTIFIRCRHKLSDVKKLIEVIEDHDGA